MNKNPREVVLIVLIIPIVSIVALIIPVVYPIIVIVTVIITMVTLTIQLNTISTVTTVTLLMLQLWHFFYSSEGADAERAPTILINLLLRFVVVHRIHEFPRISIIGEGMVFHHFQLTELTLKRFQTFPMILLPKVVIVTGFMNTRGY